MLAGNAKALLEFGIMAKKNEFLRVRADEALKAALKASAERCRRKEADQARYILEVALGLIQEEGPLFMERTQEIRGNSHKGGSEKRKAG